MKKLLFVCSQNRLRSPTAEAVLSEYEGLEVTSAGIDREALALAVNLPPSDSEGLLNLQRYRSSFCNTT